MRMTSAVALMVLMAILVSPSTSVLPSAQAASGCEGQVASPVEHQPSAHGVGAPLEQPYAFDPYYGEPVYATEGRITRSTTKPTSGPRSSPSPEEPWVYNPLAPATSRSTHHGQYAVMEIGNDSSGVLRMNLSSSHRTTFCISLYETDGNTTKPATADVYLMTTTQYDAYGEVYRMMHGGWWWDDLTSQGGDGDVLSDIPPEWRSFNPLGWQSYRDVHQYEQREELTFSVAMDGPEVYSSLFGGSEWQDFYLVIDAWDNTNDDDAAALNSVLVADVTVLPTERSAFFPMDGAAHLFVLLAAVVVVPVVLNSRYMQAGLTNNQPRRRLSR